MARGLAEDAYNTATGRGRPPRSWPGVGGRARLPAMQPSGPVERDLAEPGAPRSASSGEARLVGREREFRALLTALEGTLRGEGRLVLLAGEPGIGKTRLAREALAHGAHKGFETLVGHCFEHYRTMPFLPFSEALADILTS